MSMTIPMTAGWLIITVASNASMILVGRAICSAVSAISVPAAYSYVAEIASSGSRGFLGSLMSVGWTFGLVMSYSLGAVLDWSHLALAACTVPVTQFIVLLASEDSPRWLVSRARLDDAKKALAFFRGCSSNNMSKHVECELKDMEHQLQRAGQANLGARLKMMVGSRGVRKAVMICLMCFVFTVATGFSIVNYHAKLLLVQARVTDAMDANVGTILIGICQMAGNLVGALVVDKVGRKTLLYISSAFLSVAQAGLGTYFYFELNAVEEVNLDNYRWAPLVLLLVFVTFLPLGWGSVTYILVSEIVPTSVRTETAILCNSFEQLLQFAVLQLHAAICGRYGPQYLHWGFAGTSILGGIFVFLLVPETSGKTLEEIEVFFTHLRREALDMIGDRAACREPTKQPFFIVEKSDSKRSKKSMEANAQQVNVNVVEPQCSSCSRL